MLADIGLFVNPSKSEFVNSGLDEMVLLRETQCIKTILENVSFHRKEDVILLGSQLTKTAIRTQFQRKLSIFKEMTEKLSRLDRHSLHPIKKLRFSAKTNVHAAKLTFIAASRPTCCHQ